MRKALIVLSLVVVTALASAGNAHAQRRGYGGWGSVPYYSGGNGFYSQSYYYGNRGYGPYYQGYGYAPGYYYTAPGYAVNPALDYYYAAPAVQTPMARTDQSFYSGPETAQQVATMTVVVPTAATQVWFGDSATTQQGTQRLFQSPALEPGKNFVYTIKARWMENGQAVERERQVTVQAGQRVTVNFRDNSAEAAPPPDAIRRN